MVGSSRAGHSRGRSRIPTTLARSRCHRPSDASSRASTPRDCSQSDKLGRSRD
jgi:hypothetical protein